MAIMNSDAITKVLYCTLLFRRHFFRLLGRLLTACHVSLCTKQTHRPCCCCAGALDQRNFSFRCCGCQLFWFCGNLAGLLSWQPFWLNIVPRLLTSFALLDVFQASVDFLLYLSVWHLCYMFCALVLLLFILFFPHHTTPARKHRLLLGQLYFLLQLQLGFVITFWNGDGSYADKRLIFKYSGN